MILKSSVLFVNDSCGVDFVRCFHIYQIKKNRVATVGKFIKISIRMTKKRYLKYIGSKCRAFVTETVKSLAKFDGSWYMTPQNSCTLLKKRLTTRGKIVNGIISYNIKRKKFLTSFVAIL